MTITREDKLICKETNAYGLTLKDVEARVYKKAIEAGEGSSVSFGEGVEEDELEALGYAKVVPVARPEGNYTQVTPVLGEDGVYRQTWELYVAPVQTPEVEWENNRQIALGQVAQRAADTNQAGCPIDFGTGFDVLRIRMTDKDIPLITTVRIEAQEAIADGNETEVFVIRTVENINVPLMAADAVKATRAYSKQVKTVFAWEWNLKDALNTAVYPDALPEVPAFIELETVVL